MDVKNRMSKNAHSYNRINVLPEHMAGIVIAPYRRACDLTKTKQRLRAITTKPGCISIAIFTPWSGANLARSLQHGTTTSFHCHFRTSKYSGGHGHVTRFGDFALVESPGQPEKSTTTEPPSFSARRIVLRFTSCTFSACAGFRMQRIAMTAEGADGYSMMVQLLPKFFQSRCIIQYG
jgi:hypothetical protein